MKVLKVLLCVVILGAVTQIVAARERVPLTEDNLSLILGEWNDGYLALTRNGVQELRVPFTLKLIRYGSNTLTFIADFEYPKQIPRGDQKWWSARLELSPELGGLKVTSGFRIETTSFYLSVDGEDLVLEMSYRKPTHHRVDMVFRRKLSEDHRQLLAGE